MTLDDGILREAREARDRLIAAQHEVDAARGEYHHAIRRLCAAGGSMREIAEALGLSHQRVHQIVDEGTVPLLRRRRARLGRLPRGGLTRFTTHSRRGMVVAQEEARAAGQAHVGVEHVLLGLLADDRGIPAKVLREAGVDADAVRGSAEPGPGSPSGQLPFAPETKKVLELALREALALKHDHLGTEHLLLALARAGALRELGVDEEWIRAEVTRQLAA